MHFFYILMKPILFLLWLFCQITLSKKYLYPLNITFVHYCVYFKVPLYKVCCNDDDWCHFLSHRIQELNDLGALSPHWDNMRKEVISRYDQIIKEYQNTLAELEKLTGERFWCSHTHACAPKWDFPPSTNSFRNLRFTYAWSIVVKEQFFSHDFLVHQIFIHSSRLAVKFNETLNSNGYTRLPKEQEKPRRALAVLLLTPIALTYIQHALFSFPCLQ